MISLKNTSCRFALARYLHCSAVRIRSSPAGSVNNNGIVKAELLASVLRNQHYLTKSLPTV